MKKLLLILMLVTRICVSAQDVPLQDTVVINQDSLLAAQQDSMIAAAVEAQAIADTATAREYMDFSKNIFAFTQKELPVMYDVQQRRFVESETDFFIIIFVLLAVVTYLKLAFTNDLQELFQIVWSDNRAMQVYRSRTESVSVSTALLTMNFIVCFSLFLQFSLQYFLSSFVLQSLVATIVFVFLFTSFLILRTVITRVIGYVFGISNITSLYEFHVVHIVQSVGLLLLPAILLLYTTPHKFFVFIFASVCVILLVALALIVIRGLSTSSKVLISGFKYFFIYVCIGEVSTAFLLIKLLTKIVS
jgi:hypothetical protein